MKAQNLLLLLLLLPTATQAQNFTNNYGIWSYTTNADSITINLTGYSGSNALVTLPTTINGLPVTGMANFTFAGCSSLTAVTIPQGVTNIGDWIFTGCSSLTGVTIPDGVINIGSTTFGSCSSLTRVSIPNSVSTIGDGAFSSCTSLTNLTIPDSVTSIGSWAFASCGSLVNFTIPSSVSNLADYVFAGCSSLTSVYCKGNAPNIDPTSFGKGSFGADHPSVYYLPNTTGWDTFTSLTGVPTVLWNPQSQLDASFGFHNHGFGFNIIGNSNLIVVIEACTNLANPIWSQVSINTLNTFVGTNGFSYFGDPQWTNCPSRFYRFRPPY